MRRAGPYITEESRKVIEASDEALQKNSLALKNYLDSLGNGDRSANLAKLYSTDPNFFDQYITNSLPTSPVSVQEITPNNTSKKDQTQLSASAQPALGVQAQPTPIAYTSPPASIASVTPPPQNVAPVTINPSSSHPVISSTQYSSLMSKVVEVDQKATSQTRSNNSNYLPASYYDQSSHYSSYLGYLGCPTYGGYDGGYGFYNNYAAPSFTTFSPSYYQPSPYQPSPVVSCESYYQPFSSIYQQNSFYKPLNYGFQSFATPSYSTPVAPFYSPTQPNYYSSNATFPSYSQVNSIARQSYNTWQQSTPQYQPAQSFNSFFSQPTPQAPSYLKQYLSTGLGSGVVSGGYQTGVAGYSVYNNTPSNSCISVGPVFHPSISNQRGLWL